MPRQTGVEVVQIDFSLAVPGEARLTIHDVTGRVVRILREGALEAGVHRLNWDGRTDGGRRLARGLYVVRLEAGRSISTRKLVLLAP